MPLKTIQVTLGAAATPIVAASGSATPFMELRLNPAAHDYYFGDANVSTTQYFAKVITTAGVAQIIGNGPSALKVDDLKNCYLLGTQNDPVNVGAVIL